MKNDTFPLRDRCVCDGVFNDWDDDHTSLVHVLWSCRRDGLSLDDFDEVATRINQSKWLKAVKTRAAQDPAGV